MPARAPRIAPCCGRRVPAGQRCECQKARERERKAATDRNREGARARGYDATWERERKAFLAVHRFCGCGAPATLVDHVKPHKGDAKLFRDARNWQPMCKPCHARKTAREDGGFGNPIKPGGGPKVSTRALGPGWGPSRGISPNPATFFEGKS